MDWLYGMNQALDYIEKNLTEDIHHEDLARIVSCSAYEFSRIFSFMSGTTVSEYIRRRRLSKAAFDIQKGREKILDIALKYRYESPASFARAFKELHGTAPLSARKSGAELKTYPPISFQLTIKGYEPLNFRIDEKKSFYVYGIPVLLSFNLTDTLPSFWNSDIDINIGKNNANSHIINTDNPKNHEIMSGTHMIKGLKKDFRIGIWSSSPSENRVLAIIDYELTDGCVKAEIGLVVSENMDEKWTSSEENSSYEEIYKKLKNSHPEVADIKPLRITKENMRVIPPSLWAVFTFDSERNEYNVTQAYARILTDWFTNSGYTRKENMPHMETILYTDDTGQKLSAWEIWMPVEKK